MMVKIGELVKYGFFCLHKYGFVQTVKLTLSLLPKAKGKSGKALKGIEFNSLQECFAYVEQNGQICGGMKYPEAACSRIVLVLPSNEERSLYIDKLVADLREIGMFPLAIRSGVGEIGDSGFPGACLNANVDLDAFVTGVSEFAALAVTDSVDRAKHLSGNRIPTFLVLDRYDLSSFDTGCFEANVRFVVSDDQMSSTVADAKFAGRFFPFGQFCDVVKRLVYIEPEEYSALSLCVSVVIPTYNGIADLEKLLPILQEQQLIGEVEIICVDSGSTDGTVEFARSCGAKVFEIRHEEFSHSYARNYGFSKSKGDLVLFMTQDAIPIDKMWIRRLADPLIWNERIVATSCRQLPKPDCDFYGAYCIAMHNKYIGTSHCDRISVMPVNKQDNDLVRKNAQLDDVACLVRREIFSKYQYKGSFAEDLDLGLSLISEGHMLMQRASLAVIHSHTRGVMYHFKRGIVDKIGLSRIFAASNVAVAPDKLKDALLSLYLYACMLSNEIDGINGKDMQCRDLENIRTSVNKRLRRDKYTKLLDIYAIESPFGNDFHAMLNEICRKNGKQHLNCEGILRFDVQIDRLFLPFWTSRGCLCSDLKEWILKCSASIAGDMIGEYASGVPAAEWDAQIKPLCDEALRTI